MVILTINGIEVPNPAEMTVNIMDLSSTESGRTLTGLANKDIVARKRALKLKWNVLDEDDTSLLLRTIESSGYLTVKYPDPVEGMFLTKTFYVGDRSSPAVEVSDNRILWNNISFDLIER